MKSLGFDDGRTAHFHGASARVIVSPGHARVVPLRPEFVVLQDGYAKRDCEIFAAKLLAGGARRA